MVTAAASAKVSGAQAAIRERALFATPQRTHIAEIVAPETGAGNSALTIEASGALIVTGRSSP